MGCFCSCVGCCEFLFSFVCLVCFVECVVSVWCVFV